jgi:hypothetical protein
VALTKLTQQWASGVTYAVGDLVTSQGYPVVCMTAHTAGTFATDVQSGYWQMAAPMKNYIINGDMSINQRGNTNDTTDAKYTRDRWKQQTGIAGATYSGTQQSTSYVGTNAQYCYRITRTDTGTGTGNIYIAQSVETATAASLIGKPVTLSFKVRTNSPSTVNCGLILGVSTAADASPFSATGNIGGSLALTGLTTSFQTKILTGTFPSNALTIMPQIAFNQTSAVNNQNNYLEITEVMLNEGPAPAPFQLAAGHAAGELAMCQRYFERYDSSRPGYFSGYATNATTMYVAIPFAVEKRSNTLAISKNSVGASLWVHNGTTGTINGDGTPQGNKMGIQIYPTVANGLTQGMGVQLSYIGSSFIQADAEL